MGPHRVERPLMAGGHPHVMCLSHNVKVRFLGIFWGNGAGTYWKIWNPLIDYLRLSRLVSDVQHGKLYRRLAWETRKSICLTCFDSKIKWESIDGHAIHSDCYELLDICFAWLPDVLMYYRRGSPNCQGKHVFFFLCPGKGAEIWVTYRLLMDILTII